MGKSKGGTVPMREDEDDDAEAHDTLRSSTSSFSINSVLMG